MYCVYEDEFNMTEYICNIERRFFRFYLKTIEDYFDLDKNFIWQTKEISNRRTYTKKHDYVINQPHELLLLGVQDFCLGLRKFSATLMNYTEIAKYLTKKKPLLVYCLTGKSFLAALGICTVIDQAAEMYRLANKKDISKILLVITEKNQKWKAMCSYFVERINPYYKNVHIKLFLFDERPDRLSPKVSHVIKKADIVVMSRFLSQYEYLTVRTFLLEVILRRMKELSIIFYMDACQKRFEDTVKHAFSNTDSLIEIRGKKTVKSLENLRNGEYSSEFPFLLNADFEQVMYSICIKCSEISCNASPEKEVKDRKQMQWKISKIFRKKNSILSRLEEKNTEVFKRDSATGNSISRKHLVKKKNAEVFKRDSVTGNSISRKHLVKKKNAEVFKRDSATGNSISRNLERNNNFSKRKKLKVKTVKRKTGVRKSAMLRDEPVLDYAAFLSEIYYSKYFDKEIPCSPKIKLNKQLKN